MVQTNYPRFIKVWFTGPDSYNLYESDDFCPHGAIDHVSYKDGSITGLTVVNKPLDSDLATEISYDFNTKTFSLGKLANLYFQYLKFRDVILFQNNEAYQIMLDDQKEKVAQQKEEERAEQQKIIDENNRRAEDALKANEQITVRDIPMSDFDYINQHLYDTISKCMSLAKEGKSAEEVRDYFIFEETHYWSNVEPYNTAFWDHHDQERNDLLSYVPYSWIVLLQHYEEAVTLGYNNPLTVAFDLAQLKETTAKQQKDYEERLAKAKRLVGDFVPFRVDSLEDLAYNLSQFLDYLNCGKFNIFTETVACTLDGMVNRNMSLISDEDTPSEKLSKITFMVDAGGDESEEDVYQTLEQIKAEIYQDMYSVCKAVADEESGDYVSGFYAHLTSEDRANNSDYYIANHEGYAVLMQLVNEELKVTKSFTVSENSEDFWIGFEQGLYFMNPDLKLTHLSSYTNDELKNRYVAKTHKKKSIMSMSAILESAQQIALNLVGYPIPIENLKEWMRGKEEIYSSHVLKYQIKNLINEKLFEDTNKYGAVSLPEPESSAEEVLAYLDVLETALKDRGWFDVDKFNILYGADRLSVQNRVDKATARFEEELKMSNSEIFERYFKLESLIGSEKDNYWVKIIDVNTTNMEAEGILLKINNNVSWNVGDRVQFCDFHKEGDGYYEGCIKWLGINANENGDTDWFSIDIEDFPGKVLMGS